MLKLSTEFIVIVAGVLVALAADRWNQGRVDTAAETEYIARLEVEIRSDSLRAEAFLAEGPSISDANQALMGLVEQGEAPAGLVGTIAAAFREMGMPAPATWNDLQSTGSLALLRDPRVRGAVVDYYSAREDIALQVERSLRRGRDPFMDVLYPMGIFRPGEAEPGSPSCLGDTCLRPVSPEAFARWPRMEALIIGLESGHGAQQIHARRLIASAGGTLAILTSVK